MSMQNPLTPAGIEPATYQFVAQDPEESNLHIIQYISCHCTVASQENAGELKFEIRNSSKQY